MERTCDGVFVLTQSEEGRHLRVIGCLYWMSRRLHAGGYIYDGTGVNQVKLSSPAPNVVAWLPALTQVSNGVLSFIGRRRGWDEKSECMNLS